MDVVIVRYHRNEKQKHIYLPKRLVDLKQTHEKFPYFIQSSFSVLENKKLTTQKRIRIAD